ncbi:MAG: hypothetical protein KGJ54_03460 [Betaproteobacteria bacterium]|nr:hypothetical protein [Betaproteobacteria bacterium]
MNRIKRGSGFRGALDYVFGRDAAHKDEPGVLIGGNMSGTDVRQLSREFAAVRALRPDIGKPVWHNSLCLPEGETLPPERWQTLCDDYNSGCQSSWLMTWFVAHRFQNQSTGLPKPL